MLHYTRPILAALLLIFLFPAGLRGQYYTLGNDPARARWKTIASEHYRIIYPEETDSIARLYLYTLEKVRPAVMSQLKIDPRPVPVILHPYTTLSNGVVTWAPKRMDLFSSPDPYGSSPDPWITHLSIHESRHVGQVEHYTKGIYRVFYYLLGEQVTGLGLGLFSDTYAMEGDAVIAETQLTSSGRGRNADFLKYLRVMYLNGDFRNWDRMLFGSFRYYTPDNYVFGYALSSYSRYLSGLPDYIGDFFRTPVKYWYSPALLFDPAIAISGETKYETFPRSQDFYRQLWLEDYLSRGEFTTSDSLLSKTGRYYTEYTDPIPVSDESSPWYRSVIAVKKGMETAPKLVSIDSTGRERFIRFFANTSSRITYDGNHRIFWTEPVSNETNDLEDFSVVMTMDLRSGRVKPGKRRTKYFNPSPSVTGDTLAVAEYPVGRATRLTLVSTSTSEVIFSVEAPLKGQIRETVFDGNDIYCSVIQDNGIGIYRFSGGKWTETVPPQNQSISGLKRHGRNLYFSSDLDGVLNIYSYCLDSGRLTRRTNSEYGADFPYFDPEGKTLYYCEYGTGGYRPVKASGSQLTAVPADFSEPYRHPMAEYLTRQTQDTYSTPPEDTAGVRDILDPEKYPSRRYSKLLHMFRIHSWFPVYINVNRLMSFTFDNFTATASLGATILSQNSLGNVVTTAGYGYVRDSYTGKFFHSGHITLDARIFSGLSLELGLDVNGRNAMDNAYDMTLGGQYIHERNGTPYLSARATAYWPLALNSRGWYRSLTPYVSWNFNNDRYYSYSYDFTSGNLSGVSGTPIMRHQMQYGLSYAQTLATATSQVYPRWGFGISLQGSSPIGALDYFGHVAYLSGYAYLPGITRQQGLRIGFTAQKQFVDGKMYLSSLSVLPRGYTGYNFDETYGSVSADYAVPIYLGDVSLGSFMYLKRLQIIPFGDYAVGAAHGSSALSTYYSYGADLKLDFMIFRLNFPLSAGLRYARTGPQSGSQNYFGLLFDVSFN